MKDQQAACLTNDQRLQAVVILTEQIAILKRHSWPGVAEELEQKRAELRAHLVELEV